MTALDGMLSPQRRARAVRGFVQGPGPKGLRVTERRSWPRHTARAAGDEKRTAKRLREGATETGAQLHRSRSGSWEAAGGRRILDSPPVAGAAGPWLGHRSGREPVRGSGARAGADEPVNHTLVTILGRSRESRDTGYRKTTYRFPDGTRDETAFFGLALARRLRPDSIVILGTRGSQWSVLVEHLAEEGDEEETRLELIEAEVARAVDGPLLEQAMLLMKRGVEHVRDTARAVSDSATDGSSLIAIADPRPQRTADHLQGRSAAREFRSNLAPRCSRAYSCLICLESRQRSQECGR